MADYKDLGLALDLSNWEQLNNNFNQVGADFETQSRRIDGIAEEITERLAQEIVDKAKINWLNPVNSFSDLATSYPDAQEGQTAMVRDTGKVYRYSGVSWEEIQDIDPTVVNEVDTRLSAKTNGVINLAQFPRLTLETNDAARIQRAYNSLKDRECLTLSGGELTISTPLIFNKSTVTVKANETVTIKAISSMESCIKFQSSASNSVLYGHDLENVNVDANNLANYGVLIKDDVGLYITSLRLINVRTTKALLDGIGLFGAAWVITMDKITSEYNGRDGVRAIMNGSKQVNAVAITRSFLQSNTGNGVTINGTSHTVSNNVIERNEYGVSFDTTENLVSGSQTYIFQNVARENYMEYNRSGQVRMKVSTNNNIASLNLTNNYFLNSPDLTHTGASLVKAEGTGTVRFTATGNSYIKNGGNILYHIEGNNLFTEQTEIKDATDINRPGLASVIVPGFKVLPIPPTIVQTPNYGINQRSENILPLSDKTLRFPLPDTVQSSMVNSQNVYVETDCASFTIRCFYYVRNMQTGGLVKSGSVDVTRTSSGLVTSNLRNLVGFERRTKYEYMHFSFELNASSGGTFLYFHVPYLELPL